MPRTMLTDHFSLAEFSHSQAALRNGLDNTPPAEIIVNLRQVALALEAVRAYFCRPVLVSSGYRSELVNHAVGGSATSAHRHGLAADFTVQGISNVEVCRWVKSHAKELSIDQVIYEFGPRGWVHLGLDREPRHQALTAVRVGAHTVYRAGIIG